MPSKRVDLNQKEIVFALRRYGATVQHLHTIGHGCPDILVGWRGVNLLIEIKRGSGKFTPDEIDWFATWRGSVSVVRTVDEAINLLVNVV